MTRSTAVKQRPDPQPSVGRLWRSNGKVLKCMLLVSVCRKPAIAVSQIQVTSSFNSEQHFNDSGSRIVEQKEHLSSAWKDDSKCTLYLAPSTLPLAGLGIFTTVPKKEGEEVGRGDVFLPLFELDWHNELMLKYEDDPSFHYFNPFSDYVWNGDSMGMGTEVESTDLGVMAPGLDAAINCNLALINVGKATPVWDDGGLHRSRDPGAGAITLYHNGTTPVVYRDIPAGGELFKFYGDSWFESRPNLFHHLPLSEDYPRAQTLLESFGRLVGIGKQAHPNSVRFTVELQRDLWKVVSDTPMPSRTLNALPRKLEQAWLALQDDISAIYQPYAIRNEAYLEEHGKCFDHIRPGRSNIIQAGRGAFAARPLRQGTIISGSPLLHIPHFRLFYMYDFSKNETTDKWQRGDNVKGFQLKLNYCFGHNQSTLLLCPYGAGVNYINHNQTLANVRVKWSQHGLTGHNDSWFNLTPPELESTYRPNLAMDYVALRDIQEGEELFMDYGNEFEESWRRHMINWKPLPSARSYVSAHDFNIIVAKAPLRTEQEQNWDPYPSNLQLRCHPSILNEGWRESMSDSVIQVWPLDEIGYSCRVLRRTYEDNADLYEVLVLQSHDAGNATQHNRSGVPRHAMSFFDRPHTTDMHLRNAFRFPIMIPDDIFPQAWRNAEAHHFVLPSVQQ